MVKEKNSHCIISNKKYNCSKCIVINKNYGEIKNNDYYIYKTLLYRYLWHITGSTIRFDSSRICYL